MKGVRRIAIGLVVYVGIVVVFESSLRFFQPRPEGTIVLVTTGEDGEPRRTVVSRLETDGKLYVAANHWPRVWYTQLLENPKLDVEVDGETREHVAVPVSGEEFERVDGEHRRPLPFLLVTGFPPRRILRLDPMSRRSRRPARRDDRARFVP